MKGMNMEKKRFFAYIVAVVLLCGIQAFAGTTDTIGGAAWWTKITDIINDTYIGYLVAAGLTIKGMYEYFGGQVQMPTLLKYGVGAVASGSIAVMAQNLSTALIG
jgi:hypothetical protein